MACGSVYSSPLSARASRGRIVTESAHGVRSSRVSVAPEGGGKQVPTQGGGCGQVADARDLTAEEVPG